MTGSYIILENLAFADFDGTLAGSPCLLAPAHHVALRACDVSGNANAGGLGVEGWDTTQGHDIVIYKNFIHDNGDWTAPLSPSGHKQHGIHVGNNMDHVWILDNEITHSSGDGLQVNAGLGLNTPQVDMLRTHHIYVGRNFSHDNKQAGLWTKQAVDVVFSQNTIAGARPTDTSPGGGLGFQYAPDRVWLLFNDISNCEIGIYTGSDSGLGSAGAEAWIVGNVIHGIHHSSATYNLGTSWSPAGITAAGGKRLTIVNNTIFDVDAGINSPLAGTSLTIANNIIAEVTLGNHVFIEEAATASASRLSHDIFQGAVRLQWGSPAVYDLPGLKAAFAAQESGDIAADPLFVDPQAANFQLQAGSPAIGAGAASDAYGRFFTLYGIDIAIDAAGKARPLGAGLDIGAFEKP